MIYIYTLWRFYNNAYFIIFFSYAEEYQVKVEEIGRCGYIFEFLPDGNIICATRYNYLDGSGFTDADIRVFNFKELKRIATINDVYIGTPTYERGFVGLQIDPDFINNHYVYLTYTYKKDSEQYRKVVRAEYKEDKNELINYKVLIDKIPANDVHNGGPMEFGYDGLLYLTNGDTSLINETGVEIKDGKYLLHRTTPIDEKVLEKLFAKRILTRLEGKILRIDRDGNIPKDNPIPNSPIYTFGHRNVWGMAFHPITKQPFVTENGPATDDEINILYKGKDYGWPLTLGYNKVVIDEPYRYNFNSSNYVMPIWSTGHTTTAPTQMLFYTGSKYKEFVNNLFFLTINDGSLNRIVLAPPDYTKIMEFHVYPLNLSSLPTDIEIDDNGEIYVSTQDNKLYKIIFERSYKEKEQATITVENVGMMEINKTITFTARLLDKNGEPLVYKPINFRLDDYIIATVRTKKDGYAKLNYVFTSPNKHIIKAEFNGDDTYSAASAVRTFMAIESIDAERLAKYEFLIKDDMKGRLILFPVEGIDIISIDKPLIATVEFIDNNNSTISNIAYDFIIMNEKNDILFAEKGNTTDSNIHVYKFDEMEKIRIIIRYEGKDIVLEHAVIPEFTIYPLYILTFIILLAIMFTKKHILYNKI